MQNRIILVVGFRGSGKSTVASGILQAKQKNALFVYDPHTDEAYDWIPNTAESRKAFNDYPRWVRSMSKAGEKVERLQCRYIPDGRNDPFEELDYFCRMMWNVWSVPGFRVWMCVEEVSESCKSPSAAGMPPELRRISNQGRHRNINQIYCGLRYAEIPRPLSAGADVQILFRSQEPLDLDAMRARIGAEAAEKVQALGPHEALVFFPDRTWQTVGSRDAEIARIVMQDSANGRGSHVHSDAQEELA